MNTHAVFSMPLVAVAIYCSQIDYPLVRSQTDADWAPGVSDYTVTTAGEIAHPYASLLPPSMRIDGPALAERLGHFGRVLAIIMHPQLALASSSDPVDESAEPLHQVRL